MWGSAVPGKPGLLCQVPTLCVTPWGLHWQQLPSAVGRVWGFCSRQNVCSGRVSLTFILTVSSFWHWAALCSELLVQKLTEPWSAAAGERQPFHLTEFGFLLTSTPLQLLGMSSFSRLNKNESGLLFEEAFPSHGQQDGRVVCAEFEVKWHLPLGLPLQTSFEDSPCALWPLLWPCQGPWLLHALSDVCSWPSLVAADYEIVAKHCILLAFKVSLLKK